MTALDLPPVPDDRLARCWIALLDEFTIWGRTECGWAMETGRCYHVNVDLVHRWLLELGRPPLEDASLKDLRDALAIRCHGRGAATRIMARKALVAFGQFLATTGRRDDFPANQLARHAMPTLGGLEKRGHKWCARSSSIPTTARTVRGGGRWKRTHRPRRRML